MSPPTSQLIVPRADLLDCSPLTTNDSVLRCAGLCDSAANGVSYCTPVAGTNGTFYGCVPADYASEAVRIIWELVVSVLRTYAAWLSVVASPVNNLTRNHPWATGIPLLMIGGPDLLAVLYLAVSILQMALRPFATGKNLYLTLFTGDSLKTKHDERRKLHLPTLHIMSTVAGATMGIWGIFILGRWSSEV